MKLPGNYRFGVVAIGRNEGRRLQACLASLSSANLIVYVDSGSTDDSVEFASEARAEIVYLDSNVPFTAARARNAGFQRLQQIDRDVDFVQFIDGDCELVNTWPELAIPFLLRHPDVAAVAGRRRERFPTASVYNWLCDVEWSRPSGEARAFGGDVMMRAEALRSVGGYRDDMIAGEEPELCVRLGLEQWKSWQLNAEMTLHDAAMKRFSQWWWRSVRAGYAYALGASIHGGPPAFHKVRESCRAWAWGICLPTACLIASAVFGFWGFLAWGIYPMQVLRLVLRTGGSLRDRVTISFFQTLARFPEGLGQIMFYRDRISRRGRRLIEYK